MSKQNVCIVTDSNCCFSQEEIEKLGIVVLPYEFLIDGELYKEGINLNSEQFYDHLAKGANVSTSQPTPYTLEELFNSVLEKYEKLVYIPMSSGLSKACETATAFAMEYDGRVQVVNNRRISVTQKSSVYMALDLLNKGLSAEEIKKELEDDQYNSSIYITLETMKYLVKGGRITPAVAKAGMLLHLKPILQIQGDRLDKYLATNRTIIKAKQVMINAIKKDLETRFKEFYDKGEMELYIAHTNNYKQAMLFKEEVELAFPGMTVKLVDELSLVVSCHIGPGALALACARKLK